mgnify:CR=1 FL=1
MSVPLPTSVTTSEDIGRGTDYWRRLRMDGQVSIYYAGSAALGYPADLCLYDVLRKPSLRPKKAVAEVKLKKDGTPYANQQLADFLLSDGEVHAGLADGSLVEDRRLVGLLPR